MTEKSFFELARVFKELIDNISSGVAVYDVFNDGEDFIIKDINKAGEKITNVKRNDILGKHMTDVYPGVKKFGFFNIFQKVWKTGKSERSPISMYKDERISRYVNTYVYKLPSGHIVAIYDDVTEKRRTHGKLKESEEELLRLNKGLEQRVEERTEELKESEAKYRTLFEQAADSIVLVDTETGDLVEYNDNLFENLGYTREEFKNMRIPDFDTMENIEEYETHLKKIKQYGTGIFESRHKTKDGKIKDVMIHAKAIEIKGKQYIHSIIRDITKFKELEEKIKKSEEMFRKAYNQANLYKDIFAHDINNILQNINSSVELSSLYLNSPEKLHTIKELYEIINEQVNRGKKLIKNIKKITEIDETEIDLEKINGLLELNKAIEFTKANFPNRNLNFQFKSTVKRMYILANKLLLDVFENILINAVRHNDKSNIKIIIEVSKEIVEDRKYIKVEFKDNGLGISDYRKKDIFEKGTRTTQKSKGMGLGLSLVKKIVDNFHGDIWVEDRVKDDYKQGCNFVVLLQNAE